MMDRSRRRFLTEAGVVVLGTACACSLTGCKMITGIGDTPELSPEHYSLDGDELSITLGEIPELSRVGGSAKITDERLSDPLIIARVAESEYAVVSLRCTHYGRELEYLPDEQRFRCVSLGHSEFAGDGSLLKGPAEEPLKVYGTSSPQSEPNQLTIQVALRDA
jgi:Rieske Fe-S protein